eukprot:gene13630-19508_t
MAELKTKRQQQAAQIFKQQQKQYEKAHLHELDNYLEDLYEEDVAKKVRATGMISQLFRSTENFETLLSHQTLLQTMSRILREDMKRSIDLCINVISIFFAISNFSQFHGLIMDNQFHGLIMHNQVGASVVDFLGPIMDNKSSRRWHQPVHGSAESFRRLNRDGAITGEKQDRLLYICFYMLLNLAEDVNIERKMKKKNIAVFLVKMLERSNVELLILSTTFLKKLSIYRENKDKMGECGIVEKLCKFVPVHNDVLLMSVLRLLHNLSFDQSQREEMVKHGLITKSVELISAPRFQPVVLGLLYHVSIEDKCKNMFTYTDCIPRMYEMLTRAQDLRNTPELIALAVNLTQNTRNAEVMCEGDRFDRLIRRAFQTCDELAFKVVRNLSQQDSLNVKRRFGTYIEQMVMLLKAPDITAELFVEVLGTLANLFIPEFDFLGLVRMHTLLQFLATYAQPGAVDDDILLEVVMFVGVLCNEGTAPLLVESGLVNTLFVLMGEKKEDDEFVLQIAFSFNKFMMFEETRSALLHNTQVVFYLVDLLQDKNKEVRRVADQCLDVIMDTDEEWAVRIRNLKFESFNQEWLDAVSGHDDGHDGMMYGEDDEVDYGDGNYTIGGQRVVADFDEFAEQAGAYDDGGMSGNGGHGQEGDYDEEEQMKGYAIKSARRDPVTFVATRPSPQRRPPADAQESPHH